MPLHVSSTRAYRQEGKIVLYGLWYHHTEKSEWSKITKITKITKKKKIYVLFDTCTGWPPIGVMIPETV